MDVLSLKFEYIHPFEGLANELQKFDSGEVAIVEVQQAPCVRIVSSPLLGYV